jgi:hypothetical protein
VVGVRHLAACLLSHWSLSERCSLIHLLLCGSQQIPFVLPEQNKVPFMSVLNTIGQVRQLGKTWLHWSLPAPAYVELLLCDLQFRWTRFLSAHRGSIAFSHSAGNGQAASR